ncbi:hypothetical protein M426DRAFT_17021 [Hypoxylon sp. CI-4A]|nr:hypothetical protein M426DRAFT_17021 [Hypoxylon sp. CI-4A]
MKGVIPSVRGGRPSKVVKSTATPRGRTARQSNDSNSIDNHGLGLDQHNIHTDEDEDRNHNHHATFNSEASAVAAAAAATQHQQQMQEQQLDLTAASILASNAQNSDAHHQELGTTHPMGANSGAVVTVAEIATADGYTEVAIESAFARRLSQEPGMRHAVQRRQGQALNLQRRSNVEALFAQIGGQEVENACKNCRKGHGPWVSCVTVNGQMCGSCANCWFNASGSRCSFHDTNNPQPHDNHVPDGGPVPFPLPSVPVGVMTPLNLVGLNGSNNARVQQAMEQATAYVQANGQDKKARQLMMIGAVTQQLALLIADYNEMEEHDQPGDSPGAAQRITNDNPTGP